MVARENGMVFYFLISRIFTEIYFIRINLIYFNWMDFEFFHALKYAL